MQRGIAFIPSHNSLACKITFFQLFAHMLLEIRTSKNACTRVPKFYLKRKFFFPSNGCVLYIYMFYLFFFSSSCVMCLSSNAIFVEKRPVKRQLWILASGNDKSIRYTQSDLKGMFWFSGWRCTICFDGGEVLDSFCTVPLSKINVQKNRLFHIKGIINWTFFDSGVG